MGAFSLQGAGAKSHGYPVLFDLTFPVQGIFRHRINFPRQYTELGLDESDFENTFNQAHESLPQPSTIQEWGTNLDTLADFAIKKRGIQALPVSFSGRCKKKRATKCPVQSSTKKAWDGVECMNLVLKFSLWLLVENCTTWQNTISHASFV